MPMPKFGTDQTSTEDTKRGLTPTLISSCLLLMLSSGDLRLKESTSISHWKGEEQSLLAHQIAYRIVAQHPRDKGECASCLFERCASINVAIRGCKV